MVQVVSEVGRLRRVIVHPPGAALERMLPKHIDPSSPSYLLFDDLVDVRAAADEHAQLCQVLGTSAEVLYFQDLLATTIENAECRRSLIDEVAQLEGLTGAQVAGLASLDAVDLARSLVVGTLGGELTGEPLFAPAPKCEPFWAPKPQNSTRRLI